MNKGMIFLSGGGDAPDTVELDKVFFDGLPLGGKILYTPVAMTRDAEGYQKCLEWFTGVVQNHAATKNLEVTMLLDGDPIPDISIYDAIYIGGGNTYKLLEYIRRSGLFDLLVKFVHDGGYLYGGSAGAIILGRTINTVSEENRISYNQEDGLALFGDWSFICHYKESLDSKIGVKVDELKTPVVAMQENAGIILDSSSMTLVGSPYIFSKEKELLSDFASKQG